MNPRIFYIHIPKCAGTTVHHIIEQQYKPEELYTVPAVDWQEDCFNSLKDDWDPEKKKRIRVVKGHMLYGWHDAFGDDPYVYFTFLRHPVERVASLYNFSRNSNGAHYLYDRASTMSLSDFAAIDDVPELQNYMTKSIAGSITNVEATLSLAFTNILRNFFFVGLVERFTEGVIKLQDKLGWSTTAVEWLNPTHREGGVTVEARLKIQHYNWLDMELYEAVERAFW